MEREHQTHTLEPVCCRDSRVLILGSFPSVESRRAGFYYAHPSNRFWKVMSALFEEEITDRKAFCLKHGIALWDVIASCTIEASSDTSIRDITVNPIAELIRETDIAVIVTTGAKAADLYRKYIDIPVRHIALPSTSSANASMSLEKLTKKYSVIKEFCL